MLSRLLARLPKGVLGGRPSRPPVVGRWFGKKRPPTGDEESDTGYRTIQFESDEDYMAFQQTGKLVKRIDQPVAKARVQEIKRRLVIPTSEYKVSYCRSQGPGGQHVNKTDSKAVVNWSVMKSEIINDATRRRIVSVHANKINKEGELSIGCQDSREQQANLNFALDNLRQLIAECTCEEGEREITFKQQSPENENKRIQNKKMHSEKKRKRSMMDY